MTQDPVARLEQLLSAASPLPDAPAAESEIDRAVRVLSGLKPKPAAERPQVSCTFCGWTGREGELHSCSFPPAAEPDPAPLPSAEDLVDAILGSTRWPSYCRGAMVESVERRDAQHAAARQAVDVAALARDLWTTQAAGPWVFERVIRRHLGAGSGEGV